MVAQFLRGSTTLAAVLMGAVACTAVAHAQQNLDAWSSAGTSTPMKALDKRKRAATYGDSDGKDAVVDAQPYGGQIYCPVTGQKLGLKQPAIPVQTSIGEKKPGAVASLFGKKPTPGAVIYVCCPACAEKVRQAPEQYLGVIIKDKMSSVSTFVNAPAQRPTGQSGQPN